jgi:hypothetical protein
MKAHGKKGQTMYSDQENIEEHDKNMSNLTSSLGKKVGCDIICIATVNGNKIRLYCASPGDGPPDPQEAPKGLRIIGNALLEKAKEIETGMGQFKEVKNEDDSQSFYN